MDANGQTFRLVDGGNAWKARGGSALDMDDRRLALASLSHAGDFGEDVAGAATMLAIVPMMRDGLGGRAWVAANSADKLEDGSKAKAANPFAVFAMNRAVEEADEDAPDAEPPPRNKKFELPAPATDIALGCDDCIYVAMAGGVLVRDVRAHRIEETVTLAGFAPWRLATDPGGGAWVLAKDGTLARITGTLALPALTEELPQPPGTPAGEITFKVPDDERSRLKFDRARFELPTGERKNADMVRAGETAAAIAVRPGGGVSVLVWTATFARLRVLLADGAMVTANLGSLRKPFSVTWLDGRRFAVLAAGVQEAVVYAFDDEAFRPLARGEKREAHDRPAPGEEATHDLLPTGDYFPLDVRDGGPFLHGVTDDIEYPAGIIRDVPQTRPLLAVSLANFAASATGELDAPLDGGAADTAWHRVYVDALIPPETGFTIFAAATDEPDAPPDDAEFFPHHFGQPPAAEASGPRATWVPAASELPGFPGSVPHAREPECAGLFTVLLQRGGAKGRRVRTLRGRYLHLRAELRGNGRATPCIHAVRAWCPRFSYAEKYLPEMYREQVFGADADAAGKATREDFLGRMLANFEGVLTPLEDSIAAAWRLTDPRIAPDEALPWLAQWIGVSFEPWFPASRRRAWLRCAPELFKKRGTFDGLRLALEVATNGAVSNGRVVVLEDFRMRRTFGTLLGVSFDKEHDELLGGPVVTGNSKLGRTLILTDRVKRELFALFDARLLRKQRDRRAVDEFFAKLAFRVTVLVHETHDADELELIRRIADRESPAHVVTRVLRASSPLIVGLSALLGVDTFFRPPRPLETVTVGKSIVGGGALLRRPPSLDPRYA